MNKLATVPFYFVRHGETEWNRQSRGMGQQDIPLNARGIEQAKQAASLLSTAAIKTICHSPLARAKETAGILASNLPAAQLIEIPSLIECSWGEREGQIKGKWLADWKAGGSIPGAEPYEEFLQRALLGINEALKFPSPAIVSHGGVFWAVQRFGSFGNSFDLPNGEPAYLAPPPRDDLPWLFTFLKDPG